MEWKNLLLLIGQSGKTDLAPFFVFSLLISG